MDKEKLKKLRRSDFFKAVVLIIFVFVTWWVIFGFTRVYGSAMKPAACDGDILMYYRLHTEYKAGDMVGKYEVYLGDEKVGEVEIYCDRDIKKGNIFDNIKYNIKNLFEKGV